MNDYHECSITKSNTNCYWFPSPPRSQKRGGGQVDILVTFSDDESTEKGEERVVAIDHCVYAKCLAQLLRGGQCNITQRYI